MKKNKTKEQQEQEKIKRQQQRQARAQRVAQQERRKREQRQQTVAVACGEILLIEVHARRMAHELLAHAAAAEKIANHARAAGRVLGDVE